MTRRTILWVTLAVAAAAGIGLLLHLRRLRSISIRQTISLEGAVIQSNGDANKRLPIADVAITASDGAVSAATRSEASGHFKLVLQKGVFSGKPVVLSFRRAGYEPLDVMAETGRLRAPQKIYIAAMTPLSPKTTGAAKAQAVVSDVRVRYTINSRTETNVGSAVKTFQVANQGNVPCIRHAACSPDGKWKASSASASLDAGADNVFENARASCIAGPCPFTTIDLSGLAPGARNIRVSATNWSDTATFLIEAEVIHQAITSNVRELYPVIFGRSLSFTLPPSQEGVSLEAEIDGAPIVFPLGPNLNLSWATCTVRTGTEQERTAVYLCELKPGYRF